MKTLLLSILLAFLSLTYAQDPHFVQFNSAPTYLNPALIGATGHARIITSFRNQWSGLSGGGYKTSNFSGDFYSNKLKSGFGFRFMNDNASNLINTKTFAFGYSKYLNIKDKFTVQIGIEGASQNKEIDASQLTFGDQIDPRRGFVYNTNSHDELKSSIFDVNTGITVFTKKWFTGFAAHHITSPNESVIGGDSPLPIKYTFNGGYRIDISKAPHDFSITPEFIFQQQQNFHHWWLISSMQYKNLLLGVGFGENQDYIFSLGFNNKRFSISYSFDLMNSNFTNTTGGSHEIHLGYIFKWFQKTQVVPFEFRTL